LINTAVIRQLSHQIYPQGQRNLRCGAHAIIRRQRVSGELYRTPSPRVSASLARTAASHLGEMDHLQRVVAMLNELLLQNSPETFNSTWILERAPRCYSFIRKYIRSEVGGIDWDTITSALEPKYQRLWTPKQSRKSKPYRDSKEIGLILNKYRSKLYVFIAPAHTVDLQIRDKIAVALVRVAQAGNVLSKTKIVELVRYTIDGWLDSHPYMSRWAGREDEIREQLEGCIRRYRYSGSFLRYVFRTLEYAGRGIRPLHACSLDDPIATDSSKSRIDNVIHDPDTNSVGFYKPKRAWGFDSDPQLDR
jgi:hypothetical protein